MTRNSTFIASLFFLAAAAFTVPASATQEKTADSAATSQSSSGSVGISSASSSASAGQSTSSRNQEKTAPGGGSLATSPVPEREADSVEDRNRKALEGTAGKTPGKLLIRSATTKARIWVGNKLVGETPLLMLLAPGQYKVELRGPRMEYAKGEVDLLPNESRELILKLEQRYPSNVRLP